MSDKLRYNILFCLIILLNLAVSYGLGLIHWILGIIFLIIGFIYILKKMIPPAQKVDEAERK